MRANSQHRSVSADRRFASDSGIEYHGPCRKTLRRWDFRNIARSRLLAEPINFLLQVDPMAFEHLFEVRLVLEIAAARIGATRMTEDRLYRLGQLTAEAQRVFGQL